MTPSVPAFWIPRVTQFKDKAFLIKDYGYENSPMAESERDSSAIKRDTQSEHGKHSLTGWISHEDFTGKGAYDAPHGTFDKMVNPFGKAWYKLNEGMDGAIEKTGKVLKWDQDKIQTAQGIGGQYTRSLMAYTPYIYVKNEFAHRWDNEDMDKAIDQMWSGTGKLNLQAATTGLKGIKQALFRKAPDITDMHPETMPEHYRPEEGHFVKKLGDRNKENTSTFAQKVAASDSPKSNWQEQTIKSPEEQKRSDFGLAS